MKEKKRLEINIEINEDSKIYNEYNSTQLSDELNNYIYNQCKGTKVKTNINININHCNKLNDDEKEKIIDAIRSSYGLQIKENLLNLKDEHIKQLILILIGMIIIIISHLLLSYKLDLIADLTSILGYVLLWEIAYNIVFVETIKRNELRRLERLKKAKITFFEITE